MKDQKKFLDLTNDEIKQIVTDIFSPKKITCIKKSSRFDEITCKIYTEWVSTDGDGNEVTTTIDDEITLKNPFVYGDGCISSDFPIIRDDRDKLKQFCFAKGIVGPEIDWIINNPYAQA